MELLQELLKKALADSYAFYVKAQFYHWNVEGPDFPQYHDFFGELYEEVQGSIDGTAEIIRTTGAFSPGSLKRFKELTSIIEDDIIKSPDEMIITLLLDNGIVLASLTAAYETAEELKQYGVSNHIQSRIEAHQKHKWMLSSTLKRVQNGQVSN